MLNRFLYITIVALALFGCANQSNPTGGPKDETPPQLIHISPKNKSILTNPNTIVLEFDEHIQVSNSQEEILVTPSLTKPFDISYRGKSVILKLNETLRPETTYTFNFRNSISDITEKNIPADLKLVFSTGSYIDSLQVSGNVHFLLTDERKENITVALYQSHDTLNVIEHAPLYITKTKNNGNFIIENIKAGQYELLAFEDKNRNSIPNTDSEAYAYWTKSIQLPQDSSNYPLGLISNNATPLKLISGKNKGAYFSIKYNKGTKNISFSPSFPLTVHNSRKDEFNLYNHTTDTTGTTTIIHATDSLDLQTTDTVYVNFPVNNRKNIDFKLNTEIETISQPSTNLKATITANKPMDLFQLDSIYITIDTLYQLPLDNNHIQKIQTNQYKISYTIALLDSLFEPTTNDGFSKTTKTSNNKIELHIGKHAFLSSQMDSSKSNIKEIHYLYPENSGTLHYEVQNNKTGDFIVELIDKEYKTIYQHFNTLKGSFKNIPAQTYFIRIIEDTNQNKQWDAGNIYEKTPSEKVHFYRDDSNNKEIQIRKNWEIGPIIIKF